MATQHKHTDAVATTGAKASVETVTEDRGQGDAVDTISGLREQERIAERLLASERVTHGHELNRLHEIVQQLQGRRVDVPSVAADPRTPREAVSYIISFFEDVALGGAATDLRKAVHHAAADLSQDEKMKLREFTSRLKYAAEAVDQEATLLAV